MYKKIILNNKFNLLGILIFSLMTGYAKAVWPTLIYHKLYLIIIGLILVCQNPIQEFFSFKIYNFILKELKINNIDQIKKISQGKYFTNIEQTVSVKYIVRHSVKLLTIFVSIIEILKMIYNENFTAFIFHFCFLIIFFVIVFKLSKYYKQIRKNAWEATAATFEKNIDLVNQKIAVTQNLESTELAKTSFENEYLKWDNYYYKSVGLNLLFNVFFMIILFFDFKISVLIIWNLINILISLTETLKVFYSFILDLQFSQNNKKHNMKNQITRSDSLKIQNLFIKFKDKKQGPFNFEMKHKIIGLTGNNGCGKTRLALAISDLIEFEGIIEVPETLYISLDNKNLSLNNDLSNGENALTIIQKTFNKTNSLILIDELLDIISEDNLKNLFDHISTSSNYFIIISHKKEILEKCEKIYKLENFKLNEISFSD